MKIVIESCKSLKSVTLGESVETVGESAFYNCIELSFISVPEKLNFVDKNAFAGCRSLETVEYGGTAAKSKIVSIAEGNKYFKDIFRGSKK